MANIKVYRNGSWENSGGGQPFNPSYLEKDKTSSVSVGGTWTQIDSINLDAGTWDISACIGVYGLAANRSITLNIAINSGDATCRNCIFLNAPTTNVLYNGVSRIIKLGSPSTVYIWGQSDGSATVTQCHGRAARIE